MRRLWVVPVLLALTLAGCRAGARSDDRAGPPSGQSVQTITVGGEQRSYRLYVPASLPAGPVPLVVMVHGGFGTAEQAEGSYGWDAAADRHGFVVVYPDGVNRAWSVGGGCCGEPGRKGIDDVAVVEAMVADASQRVSVDDRRVYATGMSNGAMMSYRLACDSDLFAAVAPVAGTLMGQCPAPRQVSVLHIHGLADENVPFDGSPGNGFAKIDGPPVPDAIEVWRVADGCATPTSSKDGDVTTQRAACSGGRAVDLITVDGAGHQWPGSQPKSALEKILGLDPPSNVLDATEVIWQFFTEHTRA